MAETFNRFTHFISLGYFCGVARDLEKMGLRSVSLPFDWCISDYQGVIKAIEDKFELFLERDYLVQDKVSRNHYLNTIYNIWFYHDFSEYKSLDEQMDQVREKYSRRIKRFLKDIQSPTLFIRYISNEKKLGGGYISRVELD